MPNVYLFIFGESSAQKYTTLDMHDTISGAKKETDCHMHGNTLQEKKTRKKKKNHCPRA